jgi:hypothetical protein
MIFRHIKQKVPAMSLRMLMPNRAWPNVYQFVPSSVSSGMQNLMYSKLFFMIFRVASGSIGGVGHFRGGGAREAYRHDLSAKKNKHQLSQDLPQRMPPAGSRSGDPPPRRSPLRESPGDPCRGSPQGIHAPRGVTPVDRMIIL